MPRLVVLLLGLCACGRPYTSDPIEVSSRYSNRIHGPCPSWLTSYKTGYRYCATPPIAVAYTPPAAKKPAAPPVDETKIDEASLMARGEKVYADTCAACHQANGEGTPGVFPPLAGSDYYGDSAKHVNIVLKGLSGEITVKGATYNGAMPPQATLSDYDIAAVVTFERNSWGNKDGIVLPAEVAALR